MNVTTASGRRVNSLDLIDGEMPTFMDIAIGMTRICRWGGAIWVPNLAHSVLVAELAYWDSCCNEDVWAEALVHDVHEILTGDALRPFKPASMKADQGIIDRWFADELWDIANYGMADDKVGLADDLALICEALHEGLPGWIESEAESHGWDGDSPVLTKLQWLITKTVLPAFKSTHAIEDTRHQINCHFAAALQLVSEGSHSIARRTIVGLLGGDYQLKCRTLYDDPCGEEPFEYASKVLCYTGGHYDE